MASNAMYYSTKATIPIVSTEATPAARRAPFASDDLMSAILALVLSGLVLSLLCGLSYGFYALCLVKYLDAAALFSQASSFIR